MGNQTKEKGVGKRKMRFLRILEAELEFGASSLPPMSPLVAFHCVNNFVVVNLLMDRLNGEIFPLP